MERPWGECNICPRRKPTGGVVTCRAHDAKSSQLEDGPRFVRCGPYRSTHIAEYYGPRGRLPGYRPESTGRTPRALAARDAVEADGRGTGTPRAVLDALGARRTIPWRIRTSRMVITTRNATNETSVGYDIGTNGCVQ